MASSNAHPDTFRERPSSSPATRPSATSASVRSMPSKAPGSQAFPTRSASCSKIFFAAKTA